MIVNKATVIVFISALLMCGCSEINEEYREKITITDTSECNVSDTSTKVGEFVENYDEKHSEFLESDGALLNNVGNWQLGYEQLLKSGDYIYTLDEPPRSSASFSYAVLGIEESEYPNLVIRYEPYGEEVSYSNLFLIFRYDKEAIFYVDSCRTDQYSFSFYYRPHCGDIAYSYGSVMGNGVFLLIWHLGDNTLFTSCNDQESIDMYMYQNDTLHNALIPRTMTTLKSESDQKFDLKHSEYGDNILLGDSWVSMDYKLQKNIFKKIAPESILVDEN
ncbi:MAG: hypothetical protein IJ141_05710 [Lachnospiraceae bacterium]|nr:hypothetical protein [Lachnospiraceae bacterium]